MQEKPKASEAAAVTIRPARVADCGSILALVRELAVYERLDHLVEAREEDFRRDGFGPHPRFECLLAESAGEGLLGFALFFHGYSTFAGKATLFLEDLYLREGARRLGLGRRLVAELAALALSRGCFGLDLSVLDWNPARGFYERLGFAQHSGWLGYRLTGPALEALARTAKGG